MPSLFRSLFSFRKTEVSALFAAAKPHASCYGIKVLQVPALAEEIGVGRFLIIPTRGWPSAVARNRMRRQIKAIIFEHRLYTQNVTYILLLYPAAEKLPFEQLEGHCKRFFSTAP